MKNKMLDIMGKNLNLIYKAKADVNMILRREYSEF